MFGHTRDKCGGVRVDASACAPKIHTDCVEVTCKYHMNVDRNLDDGNDLREWTSRQ